MSEFCLHLNKPNFLIQNIFAKGMIPVSSPGMKRSLTGASGSNIIFTALLLLTENIGARWSRTNRKHLRNRKWRLERFCSREIQQIKILDIYVRLESKVAALAAFLSIYICVYIYSEWIFSDWTDLPPATKNLKNIGFQQSLQRNG